MKIAILIALFVGGGVSLGAGNTVPGDTLYPVKTSVNEEVRGWFAFSSEARANWHAERAERRLEEARVLASRNELSAEARADLESRFEIHATKAGEKAQELRSRNDAEAAARISSRIQSSAEAYAQALGEFAGETTQAAEMSASLKSKVEAWTAVGGVLEITTSPEDHNGIPPSRAPAGSIEGEIDSETEVNGGTDLEIETGTERVRTEGETGVDVRSESEGSLDVNIGL